jgi:class 3 adenylate cyclase
LAIIQEHNGDVVKFCGDALMIIWPVDKTACAEVQAITVQMAAGCGLHLLHDSAAWNNDSASSATSGQAPHGRAKESETLGLHCGVASGLLHGMCVGEGERWEFLVSGEVINHVGVACGEAKNGELFLHKGAFALVEGKINCTLASKDCYKADQKADNVFAHIKKSNDQAGMKLKRTWSSCQHSFETRRQGGETNEGDDQGIATATVPVKSVPRTSIGGGGGGVTDELADVMSQSSMLTTSSHFQSPYKKGIKGSKGSPLKGNTGEIINRIKSAGTLVSNRDLSVTSLGSRETSSTNPPQRFMSLDDLKEKKESLSSRDCMISDSPENSNSLQHMESLTPFIGSNPNSQPSSAQAGMREGIKVPANLSRVDKPGFLSAISESSVKRLLRSMKSPSGSVTSIGNGSNKRATSSKLGTYSPAGSGGSPGGTPHLGIDNYEMFKQVECDDVDLDNDSSKSVESVAAEFIEPEDEHNLQAKNYLSGYLKREEEESLYEFQGMSDVLRCFAQDSARKAVERGTTSLMAELRVVVTIFIEVIGLERDFNHGSLRRPQQVLRFMLACLGHFGGGLRQYIVDDKGCVLICGFGLPGFSHNDNCARAVETAVAMKRLLIASKLECKIGIAEGRVYCGLVGSSDRCEYAMMGASVNLAARMMSKCKSGQIIVAEEVYERTFENFVFSTLPKIRAKGFKLPIAVYCPVERIQLHNNLGDEGEGGGANARKVEEFIGRDDEIKFFEAALQNFSNFDEHDESGKTESPFSYLVESDMGMGKTWLMGEVCYMASHHLKIENIMVVAAESPQSYSATQYDTIRQLIIQIFGITSDSIHFDSNPSNAPLNPIAADSQSQHWPDTQTTPVTDESPEFAHNQNSPSSSLASAAAAVTPPPNGSSPKAESRPKRVVSPSLPAEYVSDSSKASLSSLSPLCKNPLPGYPQARGSLTKAASERAIDSPLVGDRDMQTGRPRSVNNFLSRNANSKLGVMRKNVTLNATRQLRAATLQADDSARHGLEGPAWRGGGEGGPTFMHTPGSGDAGGEHPGEGVGSEGRGRAMSLWPAKSASPPSSAANFSSSKQSLYSESSMDMEDSKSPKMGLSPAMAALGQGAQVSPQFLEQIGRRPRRRPSDSSVATVEGVKQQKHSAITCVLEWVEKNVGPEDTLTGRVASHPPPAGSSSPRAKARELSMASRQSSRVTSEKEESDKASMTSQSRSNQFILKSKETWSFDSASSRSIKSNSSGPSSVAQTERSLDDSGQNPRDKVVTKRVLDMLPLLNGILQIDLPMTEEVTKFSKNEATMMLNVLLIFIVTRTFELSKSLLVVEHVQWCDHFSMYIILQALRIAQSKVFFLGTLRSASGIKHKNEVRNHRSKYVSELAYRCNQHVIYPFNIVEIKATLESALGPILNLANPDIMSNHNLSTILDRTDGSPLLVCCLCFEIASAIKEGTFVDIESLPCGRRDDLIDLFDLLGHSDQLILKVAS